MVMHYTQSVCLLWLLASPSYSEATDDMNCKLKPGCILTHCDPIPAGWSDISSYLRRNELPITCEIKGGVTDVRQEMTKFKQDMQHEFELLQSRQQSALNSMQKKLNSAEMLLNALLEKQQQQYPSNIKEVRPLCPQPTAISFADINCTTPSVCKIQCREPRVLQGEKTISCQKNGKWSTSPKCVCKRCKTGDKCEFDTAWKTIEQGIDGSDDNSRLKYAGNEIVCDRSFYISSWRLKWECECHDLKNKQKAECKGLNSGKGACEHAVGQLIKKMVAAGIYPASCDSLPERC